MKRRNLSPQIWNVEKFESRLNDMREFYYEWQMSENKVNHRSSESSNLSHSLQTFSFAEQKRSDPFFDTDEYNSLVGVANIFLKALFYDSKLDYLVPIINTQGEVSAEKKRFQSNSTFFDRSPAHCMSFSSKSVHHR